MRITHMRCGSRKKGMQLPGIKGEKGKIYFAGAKPNPGIRQVLMIHTAGSQKN